MVNESALSCEINDEKLLNDIVDTLSEIQSNLEATKQVKNNGDYQNNK